MTLFYCSPRFLEHNTGQHPENARRLGPIMQRLADPAAAIQLTSVNDWSPISKEHLARVHSPTYVEDVQKFSAAGGGQIEVDTVLSSQSYDVALLAAGAACDAVARVLRGEDKTAFCLMRPPGHHALPTGAMGFCLFGNAALAARSAMDDHGLERVLIVDWDVHHGNGTQDIFWEDPRVGFYSAHRFPFYPGTGAADETGSRAGLGTTKNLPVSFGSSRADYMSAFRATLADFADKIRPQLVILSAGFDAHRLDPVGSLGLESEDFADLTRIVQQIADTHAGGRIVSLLEGGYNPRALAESIEAHLTELTSPSPSGRGPG